jgi:hypothetical protein
MPTKVVGLVQSGHNHHFVTGSGHEIIEKKYLTQQQVVYENDS